MSQTLLIKSKYTSSNLYLVLSYLILQLSQIIVFIVYRQVHIIHLFKPTCLETDRENHKTRNIKGNTFYYLLYDITWEWISFKQPKEANDTYFWDWALVDSLHSHVECRVRSLSVGTCFGHRTSHQLPPQRPANKKKYTFLRKL